jgi:hypothetical protein
VTFYFRGYDEEETHRFKASHCNHDLLVHRLFSLVDGRFEKRLIMYAHKVIEDIKRLHAFAMKHGTLEHRPFFDLYLKLNDQIHKAEKFNLTPIHGLYESTFDSLGGRCIFSDELGDVRLPYETCWFDIKKNLDKSVPIERQSTRCGMLTNQFESDIFLLWFYNYMDQSKRWTPSIYCYKIFLQTRGIKETVSPQPLVTNAPFDFLQACYEDSYDLGALNYALLLLNCKNIGTAKIEPDAKLNKARKKRGKLPAYSFHTLVVKPTTKKQKSIPKNLWHNRIHMCRGHFKIYTKEKPLMGKHVGRYWWQPLMRGKDTNGVVEKEYIIES